MQFLCSIWKILHLTENFYTGTAHGARNNYQVCSRCGMSSPLTGWTGSPSDLRNLGCPRHLILECSNPVVLSGLNCCASAKWGRLQTCCWDSTRSWGIFHIMWRLCYKQNFWYQRRYISLHRKAKFMGWRHKGRKQKGLTINKPYRVRHDSRTCKTCGLMREIMTRPVQCTGSHRSRLKTWSNWTWSWPDISGLGLTR